MCPFFSLAWKRIYAYGDTSGSIKQEGKTPDEAPQPGVRREQSWHDMQRHVVLSKGHWAHLQVLASFAVVLDIEVCSGR